MDRSALAAHNLSRCRGPHRQASLEVRPACLDLVGASVAMAEVAGIPRAVAAAMAPMGCRAISGAVVSTDRSVASRTRADSHPRKELIWAEISMQVPAGHPAQEAQGVALVGTVDGEAPAAAVVVVARHPA